MDEIRPLRPQEAPDMFALIQARVAWMDREDIDSWNRNGYLEAYPASYYERRVREGTAYGLFRRGRLAAAAVLLESDGCWPDAPPARYIHHLVSALEAPGAGAALLDWLEARTRALGVPRLRLDAAANNAPINAFYAARGYTETGRCENGPYQGILREKML